jgi:tripartite-type tricarboxylate transporter receptor subunit TctC
LPIGGPCTATALPTSAQNAPETANLYPAKPVAIYVGGGAGTGSDTVARFFSEKL